MKTFLIRLWQWTWGFPQTAAGAAVRAFLVFRNAASRNSAPLPSGRCGHAVVTGWNLRSAMSLGMFLFVPADDPFLPNALWVHEFGHSVQSCLLGPLFLPFVGLPSLVWASFFRRFRRNRRFSYYRFPTERWANRLGQDKTGMTPPENIR